MLVLPGTPTTKVKSINSTWCIAGLPHQQWNMHILSYRSHWHTLEDRRKDAQLVVIYKFNVNFEKLVPMTRFCYNLHQVPSNTMQHVSFFDIMLWLLGIAIYFNSGEFFFKILFIIRVHPVYNTFLGMVWKSERHVRSLLKIHS